MDRASDLPETTTTKNRSPFLRRLFLVFTTQVGFAGVGLLATYSYAVYQVDCTGTLGYLFPINILGVATMVICALMFLVADSNNSWRSNATAVVSIFVIPALFLLVINPIAARQRALRHMEEMKERIPILNEIVALIDGSKDQFGHIPADEAEFYDIVFSDRFSEDHWDGLGRCCWGVSYDKADSDRYVIEYHAADVLYAYDSSTPERGWYPIASEARR